ncbi:MAG: MipA/OmpV family protein, partial [Acidobacteriota bacterium]
TTGLGTAVLGMTVLGFLVGASASFAEGGGPEKNPLSPWYLSDVERWWHVDGLIGIESEPDYVGSDDNETEIGGFVRGLFKDRFGNRYAVGFEEFGAVFYPGERWAFGIDLEFEEGRETENADLVGLPDGEETLEGEFTLYRRFGDGYGAVVVQPDLLDRGKGIVYFIGYAYDYLSPSGRWLFSPRMDVSWGDQEHMQTEFGLTLSQSEIIGQPVYTPGGGLKSSTAGLQVQRFWGRRWSWLADFEVEHYFSKAADSPLIAELGSDVTFEATIGVFFRF